MKHVWRHTKQTIVATLAIASCAPFARAIAPEVADRSEKATVLVEVKTTEGRGSGTAFCIDPAGRFATDGHVVVDAIGDIKLITRSGETDQHIVTAKVLGFDYADDLAILQASEKVGVPPLPLGNSDNLSALQEVAAFGYPFGDKLAMDKKSYPAISVNAGKITSLRKKDGELALIQMDALVNPGNSGGPVLDGSGKVIGIVESGVPGAGVNFATPIAKLQKMLKDPLVVIDPITIDYTKRAKPQAFTVRVSPGDKPLPPYKVELQLTDPAGKQQTFTGQIDKNTCTVQVTPMPGNQKVKWNPFSGDPPPGVAFTLTLKDGDHVAGVQKGTFYFSPESLANLIAFPGSKAPAKGKAKPAASPGDPKKPQFSDLPDDATETAAVGAPGEATFRIISDTGKSLGFRCVPSAVAGKDALDEIHLIRTAPAKPNPHVVLARDGYVVGGIVVDGDQYVDAIRVIFIRQKPDGQLDPADTYLSPWQGNPASGKEKQLAGKGETVIGVFGRRAGDVMVNYGLVVRAAATTEP